MGGGLGFPPGYFDNPHTSHKLVCEFITLHITRNHTVSVPRCIIVKNNNETYDNSNSLKERISAFFKRIKNGRR